MASVHRTWVDHKMSYFSFCLCISVFVRAILVLISRARLASFVCCWKLYTSKSRSEIPGKFWNVVLEKDWEDQFDRSCGSRVKEGRDVWQTLKRRKANWVGHILRRNCLLKRVVEGKLEGRIQVTGRRWRRRKHSLDDLKEKRGYWELKEEALDGTVWRTGFVGGYGPVVR